MIKINEYFDGKVKSMSLKTTQGEATSGVMKSGHYEFGTSTKETMVVAAGEMTVKLPNSDEWKVYRATEQFEVAANKSFEVKCENDVAYICYYA